MTIESARSFLTKGELPTVSRARGPAAGEPPPGFDQAKNQAAAAHVADYVKALPDL